MDASTARGAVAEVMTTRGRMRREIVAVVERACPHASITHASGTSDRCAEVVARGLDGEVDVRVMYDLATRTALVTGPYAARLVVDRDRLGMASLVREAVDAVRRRTARQEGA